MQHAAHLGRYNWCDACLSRCVWSAQAYINEKVAPEMLEYQEDLVTRVEQQIKHQVRARSKAFAGKALVLEVRAVCS